MAILSRGAGPESGPDSFEGLDRALLAGFVTPGVELGFGKSKLAASRIRARVAAVELWLREGKQPSHTAVAERLQVSDRCLTYQFSKQSELYAFPPPELATALVEASSLSREWPQIAGLIRSVFDALETNQQGRCLMAGLVAIHRADPDLNDTDAYFAMRMRAAIRDHRPRRTLAIANLFTGGLRLAFEDWVDEGEPNLSFVADRVGRLLTGPVSNAYDALLSEPPPTQ